MEIKKGDWFRCIKDSEYSFIKMGEYYQTEENGRVSVIHSGSNKCHSFEGESIDIHFVKLYTVADLKDGKVVVDNKRSLPKDFYKLVEFLGHSLNGYFDYYYYRNQNNYFLPTDNMPQLPLQSVKDFLVQLPKEEKKDPFKEIKDGTDEITEDINRYANSIDTPINPKHYAFNIKGTPCDLFDIGNAMDLSKEQFTALRYFRKKENQIEDTKKAIKCLERLVERLESERND